MMAGEWGAYTYEDTQNIPSLLRNLGVQEDKDQMSFTKAFMECLSHGRGNFKYNRYRYLHQRKATFTVPSISGVCTSYLAEGGFFIEYHGPVGPVLTCFQCGQRLRIQRGEDPLRTHADLFRNCHHIHRLHGKRPRPVSVLSRTPRLEEGYRRRAFSES